MGRAPGTQLIQKLGLGLKLGVEELWGHEFGLGGGLGG